MQRKYWAVAEYMRSVRVLEEKRFVLFYVSGGRIIAPLLLIQRSTAHLKALHIRLANISPEVIATLVISTLRLARTPIRCRCPDPKPSGAS